MWIVPIVHQFVKKGVPVHTAFAFMLTAPIINPVVIFSTFIAFGNTWKMAGLRMLGSFIVALIVGVWLAYIQKGTILKSSIDSAMVEPNPIPHEHEEVEAIAPQKWGHRILHVLTHSIDEFFDTGRYLIIGGLILPRDANLFTYESDVDVRFDKAISHFDHASIGIHDVSLFRGGCVYWFLFVKSFGTAPVVAFLVLDQWWISKTY